VEADFRVKFIWIVKITQSIIQE